MATSHRIHFYHLIWSTKERKNFLLPKIMKDLYPYIGGIVRNNKGSLLEIGGIENHVHLLIELSNTDKFTTLIRNVKAASSSWLKKEFLECKEFGWQDGYGSFSVSASMINKTCTYIQNQEHHHKKKSYEEEYINFLDANNVKYDLRYIFD
jgi:putative transposase